MADNKNDFVEEFDYEKIMAQIRAEKEGKPSESDVKTYVPSSDFNIDVPEEVEGATKMFSKISDNSFDASEKPNRFKKEKVKKAPKKKTRKQRTIHTLVWVFSLLLISVLLALFIILVARDVYGFAKVVPGDDDALAIYIEKGTSVKEVAEILADNDIVQSSLLFRAYIKVTGTLTDFQYGLHTFKPSYGYSAIIKTLQEPAEAENIVSVRIKEGMNIDSIAALLEKEEICTASEFIEAVTTGKYEGTIVSQRPDNADIYYLLEGYLFPDTYEFYKNQKPTKVVQKLIDGMDAKYDESLRQATKKMGWTYHEVLTLASIVEMEASGYNEQMPKVAAVFLNRIEKPGETGGLLGSTPTMKYPYGDGKYDTNKYKGLPPGPLCSPSKAAIEAVLNRAQGYESYYYFVTDVNHEFYFTKTLNEHQAIIKRLKSKGLWEY